MSGFSKTSEVPWQLQVFAVSIRKKEKWHWAKPHIQKVLQKTGSAPEAELRCLDVGSGIGTLSALMEQLGGSWEFTETDHAAAEQTRKIVSGPVSEIDIFDPKLSTGRSPDQRVRRVGGDPPNWREGYQLITIFDVIEHVPDPQKFMNRLAELLAPGGTLLLTTPADGHGYYFWRWLAEKIFGIDKTAHGHVVEGFSRQQLKTLTTHTRLQLQQLTPFSFFFTEMVELAYNGAYIIKNRPKQMATPGYNLALSPASHSDVAAHAWQLRLLKIVYPFLRSISLLDHVIPIPPGYEWGLAARKAEMAPR